MQTIMERVLSDKGVRSADAIKALAQDVSGDEAFTPWAG
jgi:hypothetical protein